MSKLQTHSSPQGREAPSGGVPAKRRLSHKVAQDALVPVLDQYARALEAMAGGASGSARAFCPVRRAVSCATFKTANGRACILLKGVPKGRTRIQVVGGAVVVSVGGEGGEETGGCFQKVMPVPKGASAERWSVVSENGTLTIEFDLAPSKHCV